VAALGYPAEVSTPDPRASGDATQAGSHGGEPATPSRTRSAEPGSVVGRHVVLHELGAGGMGVVYAAYDPELDRKVALKLLLPGAGGDTGRLRLLREAQALGRLSHPNVVGIHDVGTVGEQVWLAMEFVQGQTLRQWLATPRRWPEVLEVLPKAGEGLAAAHAAGLLHRDFKPENVMVGDDGRVRVMDFGLARAHASSESLEAEPSQSYPERTSSLASSVTRVGAVVGTPSYMAPEQFAHEELSAAADQFAFCVTLWEALHGERPFGGDTPMELVASILAGRLHAPAKARAVPGWLRRVCERGLSVDPRQRWPSMSALLDALGKGRTRALARRGLAVVGVLALLGAGLQAQRRWDLAERTAACETAGDEVEAAWNPEREQTLRHALVATGVSHASTTADKVTPWLDRQVGEWREARVQACLDADVRDQWDAQTLDRSLWCLDERRMELESLVDELTLADANVLHKAVTAAAGLSSVVVCRDERVLETLVPPPQDAREALRAVRADVVRVGNLQRAGRYDQGLPLARGALGRAEALGWPPLVAAARLQLGVLLDRTGAYPEAEVELEQAYFDAANGVAPEVVFEAAAKLVYVVGVSSARHVEGRRWARLAEVALEDMSGADQLRQARLLVDLANVQTGAGAYDEAKVLYERAIAMREQMLGPEHPDVAGTLNNFATTLSATGAHHEARVLLERAIAIWEQALGPEHPYVASSLVNLAIALRSTGMVDEAKVALERAIAIREKALGPEHPEVAHGLDSLAVVHATTHSYDTAKVLLERAIAMREKALGPEHPHVATSVHNLAQVHEATGAHEAAKVLYERALAIWEKALGPEHPHVASSLVGLAILYEATGDHDVAKPLLERALGIQERLLGPEHPDLAHALVGLANVALAQHRDGDAIRLAERAVTLRDEGGAAVELLAEARFTLARALWDAPLDAGRDQARARILAEQARDVYRAAGNSEAARLAEVDAWLGRVSSGVEHAEEQ
jgi:tetratricopeptide (TPR) repeat protein/predicted Ser/Thr protein kinase